MLPCVILAGGLATRMRPLTEHLPKALLPVNGVPFAHLQLSWLREQGVRDVVFCIAHLGDQIVESVGDGGRWGLRVAYSDEGAERLGTGGALRLAVERGLVPGDDMFVLYGDSYLQVDLRTVETAYGTSRRPALMTVYRDLHGLERCNVRYDDGAVLLYRKGVDDPTSLGMFHIDYGLQVYRCALVEHRVPPQGPYDLSELQRDLSVEGRMAGFEVPDRFFEIGTPQGLEALAQHLSRPAVAAPVRAGMLA